jgi:ubiquinone/menaquinone biosynthesis C-methylase UbiE
MDHHDHVNLLRAGIQSPGGVWADLGAGSGAFTLALADLIGPTGEIYAIDQDRGALSEAQRALRQNFPQTRSHFITGDFTRPLDLPALDGLVMANALHFHRNKDALVRALCAYLKPGGRFLLVEYNADHGNPWVPYPLTYPTWEALALRCGLIDVRLLATHPSRFLKEIYASIGLRTKIPSDFNFPLTFLENLS